MMKKTLLLICFIFTISLGASAKKQKVDDRTYWSELAYKMAFPILDNMSRAELQKNMEIKLSPIWDGRNERVTYLEAFGRLMAGIAPWLALEDDDTKEGKMRKELRELALKSYAHAVDPDGPDYLQWTGLMQPLVDAAYLAESFLRAPKALWEPLDKLTKERYIFEFKRLRQVTPPYNNWILFRGMVEAFLLSIGEDYDGYALRSCIHKLNEWYVGDGFYCDGTFFAFDYYNSYVIHPMLVEIIETMKDHRLYSPIKYELALKRMQRFNSHLERLISPEGTFPPIGRSTTYRMAAFQPLVLSAWKYGLPEKMSNGQIRGALTKVMKRMFEPKSNFDANGFLTLGFVGEDEGIADYYSNNGSMYITALVFLPLGLSADHAFWTDPVEPWTQVKAWSGQSFPKDYAQSLKN